MSKARHLLGSRCPDRKGIPPVEQVKEAPKSSVVSLKKKAKTENDEGNYCFMITAKFEMAQKECFQEPFSFG